MVTPGSKFDADDLAAKGPPPAEAGNSEDSRREELERAKAEAAAERRRQESPIRGGNYNPEGLAQSDNPTGPGQSDESGGPREGQPWQAGGGQVPAGDESRNQSKGGEAGGSGQEPQGGGQDPVAAVKDRLAGDQAQARGAQQAAAGIGGGGEGGIKGLIKSFLSKTNHELLELEYAMVPFDISTFGISLLITLPARLFIAGFLGWQLKKALEGETEGTFQLTWESFMPPGTEMSVPLPEMVLYVAVFTYVMTVFFAAVAAICLIGLFAESLDIIV